MERRTHKASLGLTGIWLNPGRVETSIQNLLLSMLAPNQHNLKLRQALLEELGRKVKRKDVVLEYLGLQEVGTDQGSDLVLHLVVPRQERDPWQQILLSHQSDCPLGFVFHSWDHGRVAVVHDVFRQLTHAQQDVIRKYAALAVEGKSHNRILTLLSRADTEAGRSRELIREARRRMQVLDSSVLFSHNGEIRVQVGSISQTTKNILREGVKGEYLFILPKHLFEGRTNYADIEFVVYLNFFVRHGMRTRIAGMAKQKEMLERLLTLTIFGLFSPHTTEQPSFAEAHSSYGVPDPETYAFFRLCYEKYSIRKDAAPTAPILGLDDYIHFVQLAAEDHLTFIPITKQEEESQPSGTSTILVVARQNGAFDVRITQPDGRSTVKQLTTTPPSRKLRTIPDALCQTLQFATDRPRFGVTPLGTSHGFDPMGDLTSLVIWVNGRGILVDPSPEALGYLDQIGVAPADLLHVFLTHVHADHDGGLIGKLLGGSRTTIIASDVVFQSFAAKARLLTGHDFQTEGLVEHIASNPGEPVTLEVAGEQIHLATRWNLHPIPTNGFCLTIADKSFGYSGDTQYDPEMIQHLLAEKKLSAQQASDLLYFFWTPEGEPRVELLYHEAGIPPIHTDRKRLEHLPEAVKARTFLVHIADRDVPPDSLPGKPPLFVTHALLPATEESRQGILLRTLALVSYLYDIPQETLAELLRRARIRVFGSGAVIIREGSVQRGAGLTFFVVADGAVAIKDSRGPIATLYKADSFGEWGISHQRGFRTADAIAVRRTQLIEFPESAYHWMVAKHPVIQERIGRIRAWLPRLQLAQARAMQKSKDDLQRTRSVIEDMNANQLSAFAVFSTVKQLDQGMSVVIEGEAADGFYILLSGHLSVVMGGKKVGELSEGDVFGEVGLIEGGKRTATVTVVSADAEVLFMSHQNFQALLQTVPAFSFGIRVIAAQRQERVH
jgi:CRP-like cAMP-binding protein